MDDHPTPTATTGSRPVALARTAQRTVGRPAQRTVGRPAQRTVGRSPRRILVVSADMGGGHHATAAALEESAERLWPGCETRRIDALDVMGAWVGDAFRKTYISNVEHTPWLYEFFYSALWRHRWFATASKRFVGAWCGRRLIGRIDAFDPDLVLSTYPLGTAGLAWLIRHRGLAVPVASWVSDFAPHPFWVYRDIAMNYLVDQASLPAAAVAEPQGRYRISALPVAGRFHRRDQRRARAELGLRPDAVVALIGCGSYAFGDVVGLVRTVVEVSPDIQVVAACGRNDEIRAQLDKLGYPKGRLVALGWTKDMPLVTAAADVVIGNAGGATALEATACTVPIALTEPIAAHGAANADLMAVAGAAELCSDRPALAAYLRTVLAKRHANGSADRSGESASDPATDPPTDPASDPAIDPAGAPNADLAGADPCAGGGLDADLAAAAELTNAGRPPRHSSWPMRSGDAFFGHVETTGAAQELGVILQLGPRADGTVATLEDIRASLQPRSTLPSLRRILAPGRPGWRLARTVDVADHVDEVVLPGGDSGQAWDAAGAFFGQRLRPGRPAWQMRLIRGAGDPTLFAIKMHHSQADGISALGLLDRLLDAADDDPLPERRPLASAPARRPTASTLGRGLASLAGRGLAPRHPMGDAALSSGRTIVGDSVPWRSIRGLAKRCEASVTETALAVGAHVLRHVLAPTDLLAPGRPLRVMIPVAMRPARLDREFGNWTGSLAADLDLSEMSLTDRVLQVRAEVRRRHRAGEAPAAAAVMSLAGRLPTPLHRAFTRAVYHRRFFSSVVSFMPGARRERSLAGSPVTRMAPVLPLPPRVPVTVGLIVTAGRLDVGVLLDTRLVRSRGVVEGAVAAALAEVDLR